MQLLQSQKNSSKEICAPLLFDLKKNDQKKELITLLNSNPSIEVLDEIQGQLTELIKLRNPSKKLDEKELALQIKNHLGDTPLELYGVWVYYPWANKVVHLLAKDEFIEVRTNRNQYKITPEEEDILATKKIGIIGLSVGKAIALTIATERICGELVLADFDVIELSNLNRIQTGVANFGIKKTVVVAREIAEIDPYLKVTCYHEGLTENNINDFFTKDGKLDICIEVCDGLLQKIQARQKAKELGIAVVMNSSDRGTTDIERFDLNPNLPILHGLIDHLDLEKVKEAKTNEQKVPYLLPMLGVETSSERLKASMLEIEETITTWPQLASGVIFGGGICTDVCRRILLNQFTKSGRYFVDTEKEINDEVEDYISKQKKTKEEIVSIPKTSLQDFEAELKEIKNIISQNNSENCVELSKNEIEELVKHAIMAPSGGNIQPWKWHYLNKHLFLFNDPNRTESLLNYKKAASYIAFGAATKNILLTAKQLGYEVNTKFHPIGEESNLIASFSFTNSTGQPTDKEKKLVEAIPDRTTNRTIGLRKPLSKDELLKLKQGLNSENVNLEIYSDDNDIEAIKEVLSEVNRLYLINKQGHHQFTNEIRWNKKEAEQTKDGVDINTIDITPTEEAGLIVSKNWNVVKHLNDWDLGKGMSKLTKKSINAASAIGILTVKKISSKNCFEAGSILQHIWLNATLNNISLQPMSIATFLFLRTRDNYKEGLEDVFDHMKLQEEKFRKIVGLSENENEIFIFRLAKTDQSTIRALRRPPEEVLMYE